MSDLELLDGTVRQHFAQNGGVIRLEHWEQVLRQLKGCRPYFGHTAIDRRDDFKFIEKELRKGTRRSEIARRLCAMNNYCTGTAYGRINDYLNLSVENQRDLFNVNA